MPTEVIFPNVPKDVWIKIATKYGVSISGYDNFWAWLLDHKEIPLALTEGGKKGCSLISNGIPAVSITGIWNNSVKYWENESEIFERNPELVGFLEERKIIICFDQDSKLKTRKQVKKAIYRWSGCIQKCKGKPYVTEWDIKLGKGIDDVIYNNGKDALETIILNAQSISHFKYKNYRKLKVDLSINSRYVTDAEIAVPESTKIVGLRSRKGTGKTYWLESEVKKYIEQGYPVIVVTHRIKLAEELAKRLGVNHISQIAEIKDSNEKLAEQYTIALCLDSLHKDAKQASFTPLLYEDCILIIDECEQVMWHLLSSDTEIKKRRIGVMDNLINLINLSQRIYLSDADLSVKTLKFFGTIKETKSFIIDNEFIPHKEQRLAIFFDKREDMLEEMYRLVEDEGKRIMICTDTQSKSNGYSAQNLAVEISNKLHVSLNDIMVYDSKTVEDPSRKEFDTITKLNEVLQSAKILICTPTLGTGVSIDKRGLFDAVFLLGQGVQTVDSACQHIERYREPVPRYIYVPTFSATGKIQNGSLDKDQIKTALNAKYAWHKQQLLQGGYSVNLDFDATDIFLDLYCEYACYHNSNYASYRDMIECKLREDGYKIEQFVHEDLKSILEQEREIKEQEFTLKSEYQSKIDTSQNHQETLRHEEELSSQLSSLNQRRLEVEQNKKFVEESREIKRREIRKDIKENKKKQYDKYLELVAKSESLSYGDRLKLEGKRYKTESELASLKKTEVRDTYGYRTSIDKRLIELHEKGLQTKLRNLFYLTEDNQYLLERDREVTENYTLENESKGFLPDYMASQKLPQIHLLRTLEIDKLIAEGNVLTNDKLTE